MSAPLYSGLSYLTLTAAGITLLKGDKGDTGDAGADGTDGISSYTTTTGAFTQPAASANVTVSVTSSAWLASGMVVYVAGGGYYTVTNIPNTTSVILNNLGYSGNAAEAATIGAGAAVSAAGIKGADGVAVGGSNTYFSETSPNGVVTATRPAVCYASNGRIWTKTNAGSNNTGWVQVLSAAQYYGTTAERDATTPVAAGTTWILSDSDPVNQISIWNGAAWV